MELKDIDFTGAHVIECHANGSSSSWSVLKGGVNPGSVAFHLTGECGGKTVMLYGGAWKHKMNEPVRTVYFTRVRPNGKPEDFPDQPDAYVTGYLVRWRKT